MNVGNDTSFSPANIGQPGSRKLITGSHLVARFSGIHRYIRQNQTYARPEPYWYEDCENSVSARSRFL